MANLNLDEILALFENGERRYAEDPIFKSVADSLKMGLGVYAVLDHTLKEVNRLNGVIASKNEEAAILRESIASLKEQLHPDPEFGVCTRCGGRDDKTRVGFSECNHCYAKFT